MWKDFKWVEKRFGTKFANILKGVKDIAEEGGQEISNHFITSETGEVTFKDLDDNNHVLVTTEALQDEDSPVKELFDESVTSLLAKNGLIEVKWQELKDKRDSGQLIPGSLYRITDYNCTTTQENTRSAGHQFDIVLLALSSNKLAEEGWAMEHPTDVYDVTFMDGSTKKCYLYDTDADYCNLVLVDSLLGCSEIEKQGQLVIDNINKTISTDVYSLSDLNEENLTYNYFQNSKLEAWKVWYCLDNDTSRFAWAMDVQPASVIITDGRSEYSCIRAPEGDANNKYCWVGSYTAFWTDSETPQNGDSIYNANGEIISGFSIVSYTPSQEGRGVIYRLIDEFNNDVAYDFKNIQFIRKLTDGAYDAQGEDTWCYTFNAYNTDDGTCHDLSTDFYMILDDEDNYSAYCSNNHIYNRFFNSGMAQSLNNNVFNTQYTYPDDVVYIRSNVIQAGHGGTIEHGTDIYGNLFVVIDNSYYDMGNVASSIVRGIQIAKMEIIS